MNKLILYTIVLTSLSCGPNNKTNNMTAQYSQQDILDLYKTVQHYEEETHYGVRIRSANCNFEILINDKKVFQTNTSEVGLVINGAYAPINYGILKSGLQQITIRMLRPVIDSKTEIKEPTLANAQLDVEIVADDFTDGGPNGEYTIYEWESPKEVKFIKSEGIEMPYFTQPELTFFEHKDSFKADIPYTIVGWSESVNLYTTDPEKLKKLTEEVLTVFKELQQDFQNKKREKLANTFYNHEKRMAQQIYHSKEDVKKQWENYFKGYQHQDFKMMPLINFKLVFYGNGKMVTLEQIGPKYQWESSLWSRCIKKNSLYYSDSYYGFSLHRPKRGAKLELI
ncbi:MAG: hypothetical protein L3J23_05945 [Flavobacteriaceae bacterium]|nr:hypothetical protein [Flavobacteriaceae bacterium]